MDLSVNKKMLPMKLHYLLYNGGTGAVVPFMPVYARQLGFSTFVVGIIYSILPILGLIAKPLFGAIADRYQRHKAMFISFIALTIISFYAINFIKPIPKQTQIEFHCNDDFSSLKFCQRKPDYCATADLRNYTDKLKNETYHFDLTCEVKEDWMWKLICEQWTNETNCTRQARNEIRIRTVNLYYQVELMNNCIFFQNHKGLYYDGDKVHTTTCPQKALKNRLFKASCHGTANDDKIMNVIHDPNINDDQALFYSQFWMLFFALALSWIGMAVVVSVGDAICFDLLGDKHRLYGRQRLFGAVGWGIFSIIAGILVDGNSMNQSEKNYSVIFYLMFAALLPDMGVSSCLEFKPNKVSSSIIKDVGKLFKSIRIIVFFVWCIVVGLCTAMVWNFLFWHLEDLADNEPGCSNQERMKTLQGLTMWIQCFGGEIPFFFISGWVLKKIGHVHSMTLVLFAFGIRLCLYSVLTNPWWVLPIELMQGITFGIFYTTMATYASIVAPDGIAATLQGLVGAIFEGIGVSSGSFIGGYLMNTFGGRITFRVFGLTALTASLLHCCAQILLKRYAEARGKELDITHERNMDKINFNNGDGVGNFSITYENGINNRGNLLSEFSDISLEESTNTIT